MLKETIDNGNQIWNSLVLCASQELMCLLCKLPKSLGLQTNVIINSVAKCQPKVLALCLFCTSGWYLSTGLHFIKHL